MREPTERENVQKDAVLKKCFECLVETGIEGASINNFSSATGMASSSLYYWFKDKDEILLDATEYGLKKVLETLFAYGEKHIDNIEEMCNGFPKLIEKQSSALRFVLQVAASPKYGELAVGISDKLLGLYDDYAKKLSEQLNMPFDKMRLLVDLVVSIVIDAVIWKEWNKFSKELRYIFNSMMK